MNILLLEQWLNIFFGDIVLESREKPENHLTRIDLEKKHSFFKQNVLEENIFYI